MTPAFRPVRALALAAVLLSLAACNSDNSKNQDAGPPPCTAGTVGCECVADKCARDDRGEQLVCLGGICGTMTCAAGENGCACLKGSTCNAEGSTCQGGFCVASGCTAGTKDCTCISGSCDVGLVCVGGAVCTDNTGYEGGACFASGKCLRGNACDASTNACVHCELGTAQCACTVAGGCNAGLACRGDLCIAAAQLPPAHPTCFTPCRSDVKTDAGLLVCDSDGLLPGCLDPLTCTQGTCLTAGATQPTCSTDLECPEFQACLSGGCYSNCLTNADCGSGEGCFKHVCRKTCTTATGQASCGAGMACTSKDGQTGACMRLGTVTQSAGPMPTGGVDLPRDRVELSNVHPDETFIMVPKGSTSQDITIRKLWHQVTWPDGTIERVEAPRDATGAYRACDLGKNECPMWWLDLVVPGGSPSRTETATAKLLPGCIDTVRQNDAGTQTPCPDFKVANGAGVAAPKWEGALEITAGSSTNILTLGYVERPEGQWTGQMFYFGAFGTQGLDPWIASTDKGAVSQVGNAFIQRWGALRNGSLSAWGEMLAVATSTRTESWKFGLVDQKCKAKYGTASTTPACYPYSNTDGFRNYVPDVNLVPVPSGVSELPVAMNLKLSATDPSTFEGRIVSSSAMHYPGNPAIKIQFTDSPALSTACSSKVTSDCVVFLKNIASLGATSDVNRVVSDLGGRYYPGPGMPCASGYVSSEEPWLIPGLTQGTLLQSNGTRTRTVCRDGQLPFDPTSAPTAKAVNVSLSGGNPVPDGTPRRRTLRFIDGALINQGELFIIFEENYPSFVPNGVGSQNAPTGTTTAYGFMRLRRSGAALEARDYVGLQPASTMPALVPQLGAQCSASLKTDIGAGANNVELLKVLLRGSTPGAAFTPLPGGSGLPMVHYYCEDTGLFNGGRYDDGSVQAPVGAFDGGSLALPVACPAGSKVIFFLANKTRLEIAQDPCQTSVSTFGVGYGYTAANVVGRGTCMDRLVQWRQNSNILVEENPLYNCAAPTDGGVAAVYCDDNRFDLREGKAFFRRNPVQASRAFLPLKPLIDSAFRYKTRFRSSVSGSSLGFAPQQCVPNSDSIPYCYDPAQIEEVRARVDCLVSLYGNAAFMGNLTGPNQALKNELLQFLQGNFSSFTNTFEGFERLYAELLIMQGDDSLTAAYASRFDLAAAGGASFKGSVFETNGIDLTGVAGAEMYRLYEAVQYYQLALDRLYLLGPDLSTAMGRGLVNTDQNFITSATVTDYLERLIRAASQKAVASAQIAKRYQNFNRPDLARAVVERSYVGTYLESAVIGRLMQTIMQGSAASQMPQINITIEKAQRSYRMALLDMHDVYGKITDQMNYFGFPPDYIPFPALDSPTGNAYDDLAAVARQRLDLAKQREGVALAFGKQGKVDAAQFQSDLVSIRNNYENQLANLCGSFTGDDGQIYPAIRKYAHRSSLATLMGDPCGRMGNGDLHNAMVSTKDAGIHLKGIALHHQNLMRQMDIERERVASQCGINSSMVKIQYNIANRKADMEQVSAIQKAAITLVMATAESVIDGIKVADCEIQCGSSAAMGAVAAGAGVAAAGAQFASDMVMAVRQRDMAQYEIDSLTLTGNLQCQAFEADGKAVIGKLILESMEVELEALRADYALRLAVAEVQKGANNAQRLQAQQEETEQLSINIQAAQNDPNVRIYQNDSVINADVSFNDALSMAYRLTRVFEYYTSQSYAKKEQLFLIRMVTAGQYNLENYLLELDNEFLAFQEQYGNPDLRVMSLSLRDDIMKIPYVGEDGSALSEQARITRLQQRLSDVRNLDSNGYLTIPFSTNMKALSPLTRDHKIHHVEVDLQGGRMGDQVARVYLRMAGTGLVRNVSNDTDYYVFPSRLAVLNASLQGTKVYDPDVYRNYRFRDRPLVNTLWELVLNQRDELANQDIDLKTISDMRVLVYYTDFTAF